MTKPSKNALTHGGYAQDVLLPWEDAQAFDKLHEQIRGDLKPSGYLQEQTVREIAVQYWRKQRLAVAYALPFYKKQMTPELKEAGKGGIAGLATYLADRSNHSGDLLISTEELLVRVQNGWEPESTPMPAKDEAKGGEISKKNRITSDIVEKAYDLIVFEKQSKIETMLDSRIRNLMARLVALRSYEEMYGQKSIEVLPALEAPPMNPANAAPEPTGEGGINDSASKQGKPIASD